MPLPNLKFQILERRQAVEDIKVSLHKCPNCSAALTVNSEDTDLKCAYCQHSIHIERKRPRFILWRARDVLYVDVAPPQPLSRGAVLLILGLLLLPFAIAEGPSVFRKAGHLLRPLPAICANKEELVISDQTFTATGPEPLLRVEAGCHLTLANSHLEADVILRSSGNAQITISNSVLIGHKLVLDMPHGGRLLIQNGSQLRGQNGIVSAAGMELRLSGSEIEADEVAVKLGMSSKVSLEDAKIKGQEVGLLTLFGLTLNSRGGRIESAGDAIVSDFGPHIELRKSAVKGGRRAFSFSSQPATLSLIESTVEGAQVFDRLVKDGAALDKAGLRGQ